MLRPQHLTQHTTYQATAQGAALWVVSNEVIKKELEKVGFTNIKVEGKGSERVATGTWSKPSQDMDFPPLIKPYIKKFVAV